MTSSFPPIRKVPEIMSQSISNPPDAVPNAATPAAHGSVEKHEELESASVDLLCKLEFLVSAIKEADPADQTDIAIETTKKMILEMTEFSLAFLTGEAYAQTEKAIERTLASVHVLETLLANRSLGGMIRRAFGGEDPNEVTIKDANRALLQAVKRSIVTLLFNTIQIVGFESSLGKQLDQSTMLFVSDIESVY